MAPSITNYRLALINCVRDGGSIEKCREQLKETFTTQTEDDPAPAETSPPRTDSGPDPNCVLRPDLQGAELEACDKWFRQQFLESQKKLLEDLTRPEHPRKETCKTPKPFDPRMHRELIMDDGKIKYYLIGYWTEPVEFGEPMIYHGGIQILIDN